MAEQRIKKRAGRWRTPNPGQEMRKTDGTKLFHNVQPTRFAAMLPEVSREPINARAVRRAKGIPSKQVQRNVVTRAQTAGAGHDPAP
jgi:hypothetical protein